MKNYLAGFLLSAFLHLGVVALVINFDAEDEPESTKQDEVELSLSMFEELINDEPIKDLKPESVVIPEVAKKILPEPEPEKVVPQQNKVEKKLSEKKEVVKPKPVKKK